jgi:hypothetical protein
LGIIKKHQRKRRLTKIGTKDKFAGLVYCSDCGRRHQNLRAKSISPNQESYVCGNYRATVQSCTAHFIRTVVLEKLVLEDIQRVGQLAAQHEDRFVQLLMKNSLSNEQKEIAAKKKEQNKANRRMSELDRLFVRLYEDHVGGKLSGERFAKMSADYEAENTSLKNRVEVLELELSEQGEKVDNVGKFLIIVRKYTDIQELTPTLLREFIDKIIVHEADKSSGKRQQEVEIHYNFVGMIQE